MEKKFSEVRCVKSGCVKGHNFEVGDIYPVLGVNNGIQIGYTVNEKYGGDAAILMCHTFCDETGNAVNAPIDPEDSERFDRQDGTVPPLFEFC